MAFLGGTRTGSTVRPGGKGCDQQKGTFVEPVRPSYARAAVPGPARGAPGGAVRPGRGVSG